MLSRMLSAVTARLPKVGAAEAGSRPQADARAPAAAAPQEGPRPARRRARSASGPAQPDALMRPVHEAVERELKDKGLLD